MMPDEVEHANTGLEALWGGMRTTPPAATSSETKTAKAVRLLSGRTPHPHDF